MEFDFALLAAKQQRLLDEFEAIHGGKDGALGSDYSEDFFKSVFEGDFDTANKIMKKVGRKGRND